jgi:hypothetical protein
MAPEDAGCSAVAGMSGYGPVWSSIAGRRHSRCPFGEFQSTSNQPMQPGWAHGRRKFCRTQANNLHSITGYRKLGFHCRCRGAELVASGSEAFGNTMLNKGEPRLLCRRPIHLTRRSIIAARSSLVTIQWTSLALASPFHEDRNY